MSNKITLQFKTGKEKSYKISKLCKFNKLFDDLFDDKDIISSVAPLSIPFTQEEFDAYLDYRMRPHMIMFIEEIISFIQIENFLCVYNSLITPKFIWNNNFNEECIYAIIEELNWINVEKIFIDADFEFLIEYSYILVSKLMDCVEDISTLPLEIYKKYGVSLLQDILCDYNSPERQAQCLKWFTKYYQYRDRKEESVVPLDSDIIKMIPKITNPVLIILMLRSLDSPDLLENIDNIKWLIDNSKQV